MKNQRVAKRPRSPSSGKGITKITVAGFKSICKEQSIEIRPMTILAGANSSGKSSIMQPLLLLKQTLEATYDPGAILLNGPNVRFTSAEQLLSHIERGSHSSKAVFYVGIQIDSDKSIFTHYKRGEKSGFEIYKSTYTSGKERGTFAPEMPRDQIQKAIPSDWLAVKLVKEAGKHGDYQVERDRCFLSVKVKIGTEKGMMNLPVFFPGFFFETPIRSLIHLPGLRGNPERSYKVSAVGSSFSGTFENYVASVILAWQSSQSLEVKKLGKELEKLGLTWKIAAKLLDETQVELEAGRLAHADRGGAYDLVNIADMGFGVSQTLPVLVALQAAKPGQLVYLEQPEIHLHPRAQIALAEVLADAAKRGVHVVAETHSSLLLLAIQTLVAEKKLSPDLVKLHWFKRGEDGMTKITSADLDESGAFGEDWPEDFGDVELKAESRYLDAIASRKKKISRAG